MTKTDERGMAISPVLPEDCKNFLIDIDGTICEDIPIKGKTEAQYRQQIPYKDRIDIINQLYDDGHEIHYWTARGATRGIDLSLIHI